MMMGLSETLQRDLIYLIDEQKCLNLTAEMAFIVQPDSTT